MKQAQSVTIEKYLPQIADMLLLNGALTESPGLVQGKMGIAVFFFHYAQYTDTMLFADYAMDLISEVLNQIHVNSPADYENGIAGIGVGIDYMIRNQFLVTEEDICEDLDQRMLRAVMYDPWQDFSLYDGLTGYGRYWISRLHFPAPTKQARECLIRIAGFIEENLQDIPQEEQTDVYCFLHDLQKISGFDGCTGLLEQCRKWDLLSTDNSRYFPRLGDSVTGKIARMVQHNQYFDEALPVEIDLKQIPDLDMENPPVDMGLLSGYAGEGLLRMTATGRINNSWMFLL
jgi:hypothetical protein